VSQLNPVHTLKPYSLKTHVNIVTYGSIARQQLGKNLPLVLHDDNEESSVIAGQSPNINTSIITEVFSVVRAAILDFYC
jgi:hypothetical protein